MSRFRSLLVGLLLAGVCGSASACINDEESSSHERAFRSQYGGFAGLPNLDDYAREHPDRLNYQIGGGLILLVGSFIYVGKRSRSRV